MLVTWLRSSLCREHGLLPPVTVFLTHLSDPGNARLWLQDRGQSIVCIFCPNHRLLQLIHAFGIKCNPLKLAPLVILNKTYFEKNVTTFNWSNILLKNVINIYINIYYFYYSKKCCNYWHLFKFLWIKSNWSKFLFI